MKKKSLKVLYLFAGERKKTEDGWRQGKLPDSFLVGFNHLENFGIDVTYIENPFLNRIRKINFNLTNLFLLPFISRYDVVFSGASLALPFVVKVLLRLKRPKFVWYNTFFTNALVRNTKSPFRLWMFRKTIASLDAIVCPSIAQKQFLIDSGFNPSKIFFVHNGIDVDFMERVAHTAPIPVVPSKSYILSVGKDMGRDYKTLIEAVRGLPVRVLIAALPRNFTEVGPLPENVSLLGFVPFSDLIGLYRGAQCVVIPTKGEEHRDASDCSGQYVLLDALSLGKPVIASKRETLSDYVTHGKEALIVPPENPTALREAISKILNDDALRQEMGKCAAFQGKTFTTRKLAQELASIFTHVVDTSR